MNRFVSLALLPGLALLLAGGAEAHPHVWITMRTGLDFGDKGFITGFDLDWTFDQSYSDMAIDGLDKNGDGIISDDEIAQITANNLTVLKDYDYFTVARLDGKKLAFGDVTKYGQHYGEGRLHMHFHLPLAKPLDPHDGRFDLKVYDPDFFVSYEYVKDKPVTVSGQPPGDCSVVLKPVPTSEELDQTRAMLASKGTDWKPDNGEDFGAMFAQALEVSCKG